MKLNQSLVFILAAIIIHGCSSAPRVLTVKSDPADAEVCIKGRAGNQYFKQTKHCIGATPLEVDSVSITDADGKKRLVRFKDLDQEKEQFYLVVARPGYAPQSMMVPGWEHYVSLRQEQTNSEPAPLPFQATGKSSARISSDPVGALVYVNDFLRGNTPFVLEGENGQTVRLKIEQAGFRSIERSITIESGKSMEINLTMERDGETVVLLREEARAPASMPVVK